MQPQSVDTGPSQPVQSQAIPSLMTVLKSEYGMAIRNKSWISLSGVDDFIAFAEKYLADNPPVEVFYPGVGIGLRLSNNQSLLIAAPAADQQGIVPHTGDMQPSGAVSITRGNPSGVPGSPPR